MTLEQKINRGSVIIFILSILFIICLVLSTTLSYFAGQDSINTILMLGGPVRVAMIDRTESNTSGTGELKLSIGSYSYLLPGMGIDMQAIAKVASSDTNPSPALLRTVLDITVENASSVESAQLIEDEIKQHITNYLVERIEQTSTFAGQDGWIYYEGCYYYCSKNSIDGQLIVASVVTSVVGNNVTFINGLFALPGNQLTNEHSNVNIDFNVRFEAVQAHIVDTEGVVLLNTLSNVKTAFESINWETNAY